MNDLSTRAVMLGDRTALDQLAAVLKAAETGWTRTGVAEARAALTALDQAWHQFERASAQREEKLRRALEEERASRRGREGTYFDKTRSQILAAHSEVTLILESIPSILIGVGRDGRITRWSSAAERAFGLTQAQVAGKPFNACGIRWDWASLGPKRETASGRTTHLDDVPYERPDGTGGYLSVTFVHLAEAATTASSTLVFMVDVTDRKRHELLSVQSMKLEAIGQLAAGIAHEINTPTQFVGDNLQFMRESFGSLAQAIERCRGLVAATAAAGDAGAAELERSLEALDLPYLLEELPKALSQSSEGIDRITSIVQAMKEFSHPDPGTQKLVDLNRALESTINVARNEWKYVATVETRFDSTLPSVPCNAGELNQVFLNVLINAAHAIASARRSGLGVITIATRLVGEHVEVTIADTGTGIPEGARERLFDPFFTTKPVGEGTGQGLYIAREIVVKRHRGTIDFVTETGLGTTFRILLPLAAASEASPMGDQP